MWGHGSYVYHRRPRGCMSITPLFEPQRDYFYKCISSCPKVWLMELPIIPRRLHIWLPKDLLLPISSIYFPVADKMSMIGLGFSSWLHPSYWWRKTSKMWRRRPLCSRCKLPCTANIFAKLGRTSCLSGRLWLWSRIGHLMLAIFAVTKESVWRVESPTFQEACSKGFRGNYEENAGQCALGKNSVTASVITSREGDNIGQSNPERVRNLWIIYLLGLQIGEITESVVGPAWSREQSIKGSLTRKTPKVTIVVTIAIQ